MVVILMGAAGSGKTTVGRALAADVRWAYVEGDEHHPARNIEKMHAGIPLTDEDRRPWLAALHALIARALDRREHGVMACSALKRAYRDMLRGNCYPVRFVYLQAPERELLRRLSTRAGHFAGPNLLETQLAALEPPSPDEALVVDATRPPERIVREVRMEFGL